MIRSYRTAPQHNAISSKELDLTAWVRITEIEAVHQLVFSNVWSKSLGMQIKDQIVLPGLKIDQRSTEFVGDDVMIWKFSNSSFMESRNWKAIVATNSETTFNLRSCKTKSKDEVVKHIFDVNRGNPTRRLEHPKKIFRTDISNTQFIHWPNIKLVSVVGWKNWQFSLRSEIRTPLQTVKRNNPTDYKQPVGKICVCTLTKLKVPQV